MRKIYLVIIGLILVLTACGSKSGGSETVSGEKDQLQKVSLMLDWYPNAVHSFLYTALEKGYFKEQGLDVEIQMPADTNDPLRLVAAGQVDMALSYQPQVLIARGEDIPVQSFAAIVRHPLNQLMVPTESGIQTPKDLAGKTIGYPSIPLYETIVSTMVKDAGEDPNKLNMVDIGWDLIPALATKKTDAIIGGFINHEKLLLEKEGHSIRAINPADFGVPDYYELVMVASEKNLKENAEVYKKFMAAAEKGQKFVVENPEEGLSILLKQEDQSSPLDKEIETKSLEILLPLMDAEENPFGHQEPETWNNVANWLQQNNLIKTETKPEQAYINL